MSDSCTGGVGSRKRLRWVLLAFVLCVSAVIVRAAQLEFTSGARFRELARQPVTKQVSLPAMRGKILARDGAVLACDQPITSLAVHYRYLEEPVNQAWLRTMARARLSVRERRDKQLVAQAEAEVLAVRVELHSKLRKLCKLSSARWQERIGAIQSHVSQLAANVNRRRLERYAQSLAAEADESLTWQNWPAGLASLFSAEIPRPPAVVVVAEELDYHIVCENLPDDAIANIRAEGDRLPGMRLVEHTRRSYPLGALAAHLVGHVGRADGATDEQRTYVGRMGVELARQADLQGHSGLSLQHKNHRGELLDVERLREAQAGDDLRLAIDVGAQQCAESLLDRSCRPGATADRPGEARGGAVVVLDIETGETLVLASAPRFEPKWFAAADAPELAQVLADERRPLFDRAIKMAIPAGSVFKTLSAVAMLEAGVLRAEDTFHCQGYLREPDRQRCQIYRRFGVGHGDITLGDALAQSCNVFFFHYAAELGSGPLVHWSRRFGFGQTSGIELPDEAAGNIPLESDAEQPSLSARASQTQAFAIGQGALTVTPLQVARMMAAIANGGKLPRPTIYAAQHNSDTSSKPNETGQQIELHAQTLSAIREGLVRVVSDPSGTAYATARLPSLKIAGKTGTAENGTNLDHGWFAGYAPADEPKLAFVVVLEHSADGAAAASTLARRLIEQLDSLGYFPQGQMEVATQPEYPPGKG